MYVIAFLIVYEQDEPSSYKSLRTCICLLLYFLLKDYHYMFCLFENKKGKQKTLLGSLSHSLFLSLYFRFTLVRRGREGGGGGPRQEDTCQCS